MNLFDELAADAKKDLDSGVFLQDNGGADPDVTKAIDDMEKRMQDTLNKAVEKINNVNSVDAATGNNNNEVPEVNNNNLNNNEGENAND